MNRILAAAAVFGLLSISACSSSPKTDTSDLPACRIVFAVGHTIDAAKATGECTDAHGGTVAVGTFSCKDGRKLFQVDAASGTTAGWGFGGGKYVAADGDIARDPKYRAAYDKCFS